MAESFPKPFTAEVCEELAHLRTLGYRREFLAGARIFSTGDAGDGVYLVESGRVTISAAMGSSPSRVLATIPPGDCFGEMAALDDGPRSADATAETVLVAKFVSRDELRDLLLTNPKVALGLIREFSRRIRNLNQKYIQEMVDEERLAAVGRFANSIVHDFKSPLHVITLAVDNLTPSSDELHGSLHRHIKRQVGRMGEMLEELLEFSRPGGTRPSPSRVIFSEFFESLIADLRPEMCERGIQLYVPSSGPNVEVDLEPRRLARLFNNLASNAADAMANRGTLTINVEQLSKQLKITVSDTGPGIAPQIADRLFQPFATYGKKRGTGLGLSICRKIMEDHRGSIVCRNETGCGATFILYLPVLTNYVPVTPRGLAAAYAALSPV